MNEIDCIQEFLSLFPNIEIVEDEFEIFIHIKKYSLPFQYNDNKPWLMKEGYFKIVLNPFGQLAMSEMDNIDVEHAKAIAQQYHISF